MRNIIRFVAASMLFSCVINVFAVKYYFVDGQEIKKEDGTVIYTCPTGKKIISLGTYHENKHFFQTGFTKDTFVAEIGNDEYRGVQNGSFYIGYDGDNLVKSERYYWLTPFAIQYGHTLVVATGAFPKDSCMLYFNGKKFVKTEDFSRIHSAKLVDNTKDVVYAPKKLRTAPDLWSLYHFNGKTNTHLCDFNSEETPKILSCTASLNRRFSVKIERGTFDSEEVIKTHIFYPKVSIYNPFPRSREYKINMSNFVCNSIYALDISIDGALIEGGNEDGSVLIGSYEGQAAIWLESEGSTFTKKLVSEIVGENYGAEYQFKKVIKITKGDGALLVEGTLNGNQEQFIVNLDEPESVSCVTF